MKTLAPVLAAFVGALLATGFLAWRDRAGEPAFPPATAAPAASLLAPVGEVSGAASAPVTVHPAGLMINAPLRPAADGSEELAFFGTFARTRIAFELVDPGAGIVDLARDACALTAFADDRGRSLMPSDGFFGPFEMMPRVSEDRRSILVTLGTDELPSAGATALRAAGTVALLVSDEQVAARTEEVEVAPGATFSAGPWSFTVTQAGPSEWSDAWSLTLRTDRDTAPIVGYAFRAAGGTEVALRPSMSMSGMGAWEQTLECESPLGKGTFAVTHWKDARLVELPFELTTGLGLARRTSAD